MTFNKWLILNYGQIWQGINDDLIFEGLSEDERHDYYNKLIEEYEEHCEELDVEVEID